MNYYEIAVKGINLDNLIYESNLDLIIFSIVKIKLKSKSYAGIIIKKVQKPNFKTSAIIELEKMRFSQLQIDLAQFISYYYTTKLGIVFSLFETYHELNTFKLSFIKQPNLSQNQLSALKFTEQNNISLLFGDTGSGKSEIYITAIKNTLNIGKQALFLMPEISLTPQMQTRLENYFGSSIGIWHSKISPKKKKELLEKFFLGEIKLIAGARSALFLPFTNLGIIIVDEEHDDSYKNSSQPYYNARDLAIYISKKYNIKLILGSATPSITTHYKIPHFRLKGTYFESKKEFIFDENQTTITPLILQNLEKILSQKKQAVIFLPTRANFKFLICKECHKSIKCPFCSVGMSMHKNLNSLRCHYCNFAMTIPKECPSCFNEMLEAKKMGTSELILELQKYFIDARIAKFDKDSITTQKKLESLLKDFNSNKIDILVGTQMLSKGHDYHNVSLAIIMGLDEHLEYCDFRAREKTLSLAIQVAGRAGRAGNGLVLIQTLKKDFFEHYIENYDEFIKNEIKFRKPLYPPFSRLLRIIIQDKSAQNAIKTQDAILEFIKNIKDIEIIGYGKANIEFIASKFRREILIRSNKYTSLLKAAKLAEYCGGSSDMDPLNFN